MTNTTNDVHLNAGDERREIVNEICAENSISTWKLKQLDLTSNPVCDNSSRFEPERSIITILPVNECLKSDDESQKSVEGQKELLIEAAKNSRKKLKKVKRLRKKKRMINYERTISVSHLSPPSEIKTTNSGTECPSQKTNQKGVYICILL